jgi:hypothetical protein
VTPSSGAPIPSLLGYDPRNETERWRVRLGVEQLAPNTTIHAELFHTHAIVVFTSIDEVVHVWRLSLTDGSCRWEATILPSDERACLVHGVVVGDERAFVQCGGHVHSFGLNTGQ